MYVPPYKAIVASAGVKKSPDASQNSITISKELLKLMLQVIISTSDFDEASYLRLNPDVAEAVRRGDVASGRMHYIGFGYFEDRLGGADEVDAAWYEKTYPDVAQGIRSGKVQVKTVVEHFRVAGAAEGRAPNASSVDDAQLWKKAMGL